MDVPTDFELGQPHHFARLVGLDEDHHVNQTAPDGVWVEVSGGGLPRPLVVRIDQTADGRFIITGMLIGRDEHREIDWAVLRSIKPASIISMIFAGFDPRLPEQFVTGTWHKQWDALVDAITPEDLKAAGVEASEFLQPAADPGGARAAAAMSAARQWQRALTAHDIWRLTGGQDRAVEVNRPRASVATNLSDFARAYMRNVAADPRRATTATARELHISRATAIRRIKECRDLGLIPPQENT